MIIDIQQEERILKISYYNKEGDIDFKIYKLDKVANWVICPPDHRYKSKEYLILVV
jgi:hypothetical protein